MASHSMEPNPAAVSLRRRLPIGAETLGQSGVHFRVWAPGRKSVEVIFEDPPRPAVALEAGEGGYFSGLAPLARDGMTYRLRLDEADACPDPASRFQPKGPFGPSQIVDPSLFQWSDRDWPGVSPARQVLYEMHIGAFTPEGTWTAATQKLATLAELGITCLEVMPVADFPGKFGWGYDGVSFFAPTRLYGAPDDFRQFIDRAHALKLGVILDVVYNHVGPDGSFFRKFSERYFNPRHNTEWGPGLNFDGPDCASVREFFISNARYWIQEFHLDGFRFDATQAICDDTRPHIIAEIARAAREAAGARAIYLVGENEPQQTHMVRPPADGGWGLDALWNDDFHHSAMVALAGQRQGYNADFTGRPQELVSAAKRGFLYQGQRSSWQKKRRGTPTLDLPRTAFVNFIENHDQIANSVWGKRAMQLAGFGQYKAMTALMLMMPQTPMLFQGQEFGSTRPFLFFADHHSDLARLVRKGRARFMTLFAGAAEADVQACLHDPCNARTFAQCKLDWSEFESNKQCVLFHRDLLRIRREQPALDPDWPGQLDGAVLGDAALALRYIRNQDEDLLLLVNLGAELHMDVAPEPLLAPPRNRRWRLIWTSEDPRYGGSGTPPPESDVCWHIPGHAAIILSPAPLEAPAKTQADSSRSAPE